MTKPLISVITVCYNAVNYIEATILNVIGQKDENIQFIIIDGGSTDGTVEIIKKYEGHIKYWISESDKGIYDAMNKAWAKADNDSYLLYLGAGDKIIALPDMSLYGDADVIYGDAFLGENKLFKSTVGWRSYLGNTIHHQAMLVKKSLHFDPPFSLDFKIYSDFDFNQRLLKQGVKFCRDHSFQGYALEGGVSEQLDIDEIAQIVTKNHGFLIGKLSKLYFKLQKLNGVRKNNSSNSTV